MHAHVRYSYIILILGLLPYVKLVDNFDAEYEVLDTVSSCVRYCKISPV